MSLLKEYVFIIGYVTLWGIMLQLVRSLAGALVYIVRCLHLYSFESYVRHFALKIKYPMTKGYEFCFPYLYLQNIISICVSILLLYELALRLKFQCLILSLYYACKLYYRIS